jgi:hypothetical protein
MQKCDNARVEEMLLFRMPSEKLLHKKEDPEGAGARGKRVHSKIAGTRKTLPAVLLPTFST